MVKPESGITIFQPCSPVEIRCITGQVHFSEIHDDYTLSNGLSINMKGLGKGQYIVMVIYGNRSVTKKILVN